MRTKYLTNARIILEDQVIENGSLLIDGEQIEAICPEPPICDQEIDLKGKTLMPGIIDLHSDAIEKIIEPRNNVLYPFDFSIAQVDRLNAMAGVTTAYHALSFSNGELGIRSVDAAKNLAQKISQWSHEHSLINNCVHVRYEITDPETYDTVREMISSGVAQLVSLMDHTPCQGQFKTVEAYKNYYIDNHGMSDAEVQELIDNKLSEKENSIQRVYNLAQHAIENGLAVAMHDVDQPAHIHLMKELGMTIAEFPINMETAEHATNEGLVTVLGAPNIVRGGSQSGSMRAMDAVIKNACSALCSDYTPATLLPAMLRIVDEGVLPMHEAAKLITTNPARGVGLNNKGIIQSGYCADLIVFDMINGAPLVTNMWRNGRNVMRNAYHGG